MKPINLQIIVEKAWREPFTTKSDFARENANDVAAAASLGYITTALNGDDTMADFSNAWLVTAKGLSDWRFGCYDALEPAYGL